MKTRIIGAIVAIVLAAVGTFVLVNYVRTADVRAAEGAEFVRAYIVEEAVPAGTPGTEITEYIAVKEIPALSAVPGSSHESGRPRRPAGRRPARAG